MKVRLSNGYKSKLKYDYVITLFIYLILYFNLSQFWKYE